MREPWPWVCGHEELQVSLPSTSRVPSSKDSSGLLGSRRSAQGQPGGGSSRLWTLCKLFLGLDLGRGLGNCFLLQPPPQNGILERLWPLPPTCGLGGGAAPELLVWAGEDARTASCVTWGPAPGQGRRLGSQAWPGSLETGPASPASTASFQSPPS